MVTKLILIEGIPGSGKSTTAKFVENYLRNKGLNSHLFQEGDLNHPADYESVACFTDDEYNTLLNKFEEFFHFIHSITTKIGDYYFIHYLKTKLEINEKFSQEMYDEIEKFDVYKRPLDIYRKVILDHWKKFVEYAKKSDEIFIFECTFLQNIVNVFLARDDRPYSEIREFLLEISSDIKDLNPILFYYSQDQVEETIERVKKERSPKWLQFSISYYTEQLFGQNRGLTGYNGLIAYLKSRKQLELKLLLEINVDYFVLNNSSYRWESSYEKIKGILESRISEKQNQRN